MVAHLEIKEEFDLIAHFHSLGPRGQEEKQLGLSSPASQSWALASTPVCTAAPTQPRTRVHQGQPAPLLAPACIRDPPIPPVRPAGNPGKHWRPDCASGGTPPSPRLLRSLGSWHRPAEPTAQHLTGRGDDGLAGGSQDRPRPDSRASQWM